MESALLGSPLVTVVLGMAATLLALALLVQVMQELWKFLLDTRADCYTRVLEDFLGPWARQMMRPGVLPEFHARGPFQFFRVSPRGTLLPLGRDDLVEGLERTAAPWHRRALRALRVEAELQADGASRPSSAEWSRFQSELAMTEPGGPADVDRRELRAFLKEAGLLNDGLHSAVLDAARTLRVFRERFFSHVLDAERHYGRLQELFEYQYRRRNMLLTFLFGFLAAFFLALPVQHIHRRATAMTPEDAVALADNVQQIYERVNQTEPTGGGAETSGDTGAVSRTTPEARAAADSLADSLRARLTEIVDVLGGTARGTASDSSWAPALAGISEFSRASTAGRWWYLFGCLVTGVLVSFGAPFWNDLVGALANRSRLVSPAAAPASSESSRG